MIVKALFALALASVPSAVVPAVAPMTPERLSQLVPAVEPEQPDMLFINYPLVHRVDCKEGRGTAFRIGPTRFLTAAHVSKLSFCAIEGNPITIVEQDGVHDFAIIEAGPPKAGAFRINCDGFTTSHWYWAVGHAAGADFQTAVAVYSSAFNDKSGLRIFIGKHDFIPGMSGGPVMNELGEVVGIVNAHNALFKLSFSRALKDTSLCRS